MNNKEKQMFGAPTNHSSRREFMRQMLGLCLPGTGILPALGQVQQSAPQISPPLDLPAFDLNPEDDQFLNDLESADFLFFWEQASPKTGMVKDRCNVRANN